MEGIQDGRARDDCFACGLLYPDRAGDCRRCGGRMRWEPAAMCDERELSRRIAAAARAYRAAEPMARRESLDALLELLHRFAPASLAHLRAHGLTIAGLRAAYERRGDAGL